MHEFQRASPEGVTIGIQAKSVFGKTPFNIVRHTNVERPVKAS